MAKYILNNGLTVIIKPISGEDIVSIHAKIKAGLSSENEFTGTGITHFIEHMIFKGTKKRSALQIAKEFDSIGG
ncbi:MAG: insulinase family protein, partial [Candidatus Omnitrophica bacterium]|nr:insulinase family protein [Candidatus Omnitrophota bacterium]